MWETTRETVGAAVSLGSFCVLAERSWPLLVVPLTSVALGTYAVYLIDETVNKWMKRLKNSSPPELRVR